MTRDIEEIKEIRKQLDLTQHELAKRSNVSQSLIAKIESGRIDPTYSKTVRIFDALNSLSKKQEKKAEEIMQKKIISCGPEDSITDVIKKMKKYEISQMPVMSGCNAMGIISEAILLDAVIEKKGEKVKEVMADAPPVVSDNTTIEVVSMLLKYFPLVIVTKDGKPEGVITKSDILRNI